MVRWLFPLLALAACGSDDVSPDKSVESPGSHAVGTERFEVTDASRSRTLVVQAWFPTDAPDNDAQIETLEIDPVRTRYGTLLAAAPPRCPEKTLGVSVDSAPAAGPFPLVMISHCHACTRLSNATTAVRLASHGFIAMSVEHLGDTLWEKLDGTEAPIDGPELEIRTADVRFVLDQVAAGTTPVGANADLENVGMLGHSMGAVTAGRVAQLDERIDASMALAAPMENALVPGVMLSEIHVPVAFLVAVEDNSITELGNVLLRGNFKDAKVPAWKIEVPDAGHWSVSDLDGLVDLFKPGCGDDTRQTDDMPFTYIDPPVGRDIAASYATAFFEATLKNNAGARAYMNAASKSFGVTLDVMHHD